MHCIFINLGGKLISIWFDQKFHDHPASLRKYLNLVNERIKSMRAASFIPRVPRTLDDIKFWKA